MKIPNLYTNLLYQLPPSVLAKQTVERGEGRYSDNGALVIMTGEFTGRSPADKFIVKDNLTEKAVDWNNFNQPISADSFSLLEKDMLQYLNRKDEVWVRDAFACADTPFRLPVRFINELPSGNHFVANMFNPPAGGLKSFEPEWIVIQAPGFQANPLKHGTRQGNFTIISFSHKAILIGGSGYTGEIKKGVFTVLNFILPTQHNVLSMHCSANEGPDGDIALFFGLSGTGKTTLSADPTRKLIGDDEQGWDENGVFNIEGGCYAKVINMSKENEPAIFNAIRHNAIVENTSFYKDTSTIDFTSSTITENTRVSYPLSHIDNAKTPAKGGNPKNIFFLACDACGVLPPISKLDHEQAMFYFINGYTAKVAGTEDGVKKPQVTFSACFGAPFLPLSPERYAALFKQKLEETGAVVWLVNTGWIGGAVGDGERVSLKHTRAMIAAAISGGLSGICYNMHPVFKLAIPQNCSGVPKHILNPWEAWKDESQYYEAACKLAKGFQENYRQFRLIAVQGVTS